MHAIAFDRYGSPDVLRLRDVAKPEVGDDKVLVRVCAASINAYDWHHLRGQPYLVRLSKGLRAPSHTVLGLDLAGQVEAVGKHVTEFRPGDHVFGSRAGALAEFVCGRADDFVAMPSHISFAQAAAVPTAATTALQALRDKGNVQAGHRVLINGAAGGVGTFAVQIAASFGAEVTGVCSSGNLDLIRSIGAAHVIDYTREDFTRNGQRYDLILDIAANRPISALRRVLAPAGTLVIVGAAKGNWIGPIAPMLTAALLSRVGKQTMGAFLAKDSKENLIVLRDLLVSGAIRPVIDRTYPLAETPDAIRYLEAGHARGKVVITV